MYHSHTPIVLAQMSLSLCAAWIVLPCLYWQTLLVASESSGEQVRGAGAQKKPRGYYFELARLSK